MSLVAGDVGSKTILPDGAQVDHLSENTVGHGARPQAITNPTVFPIQTGDIGQQLEASNIVWQATSAGTTNCASLPLPAGVWLVSAVIGLNSTPGSRTFIDASLVTSNGTTQGTVSGKDRIVGAQSVTGTYNNGAVTFAPRVFTSIGSTTIYLNGSASAASTSASDYGYISAVRIA
jgi:hypothetical protein